MFRKISLLLPATASVPMLAAVAVKPTEVQSTPSDSKTQVSEDESSLAHYNCKPSDLPLYAPLHDLNKPKPDPHVDVEENVARETIESGVRAIRTEVQTGYNKIKDQVKQLDVYYETAKAHTQSTIDYLNEPQNVLPRSGAIAIGGLSGFIFAARGGFIKKVLYTGIGAGTIASLCYPRHAEDLAHEALHGARKGFAVACNFIKGVKPGDDDPSTVETINKFPTSLEEVKFLIWDLYDDAKDALFGETKPKEN